MKPLAPFPWGTALVLLGAIGTTVADISLWPRLIERLHNYEQVMLTTWVGLGLALIPLGLWIWFGTHAVEFWRWAFLEASRRRSSPVSPCWDHPWRPDGHRFGSWSAVWTRLTVWGRGFTVSLTLYGFALLVQHLDFATTGWYWFSLAAVVPVLLVSWAVLRSTSSGSTFVRYPDFPLGGDGRVDLVFETDPEGPAYRHLRFELLCRPAGGPYAWDLSEREPLTGEADFRLVVEFEAETGAPDAGGGVPVSFELPPEAPSTSFCDEPWHRYELWIDAETTAGKWTRCMLLPVYPSITPR